MLLRRGDLLGFRDLPHPGEGTDHGGDCHTTLRFVRNDTKLWVSYSLNSALSNVVSLAITPIMVIYEMNYLEASA